MHFKNHLEGGQNKTDLTKRSQTILDPSYNSLVYVKKWMKTKHAIIFRLSNKVVQVNFED